MDIWTQITQMAPALTMLGAILGGNYLLTRNMFVDLKTDLKVDIERIRVDIDRIDQYHREDIKQVNDNMAKINDRWIELFKQFHILDKNSQNKGASS